MLRLLKRSTLSLAALILAASPLAAQEPKANPNVRFGLPAPAKADPASREAYLIDRPQFVLFSVTVDVGTRSGCRCCARRRGANDELPQASHPGPPGRSCSTPRRTSRVEKG